MKFDKDLRPSLFSDISIKHCNPHEELLSLIERKNIIDDYENYFKQDEFESLTTQTVENKKVNTQMSIKQKILKKSSNVMRTFYQEIKAGDNFVNIGNYQKVFKSKNERTVDYEDENEDMMEGLLKKLDYSSNQNSIVANVVKRNYSSNMLRSKFNSATASGSESSKTLVLPQKPVKHKTVKIIRSKKELPKSKPISLNNSRKKLTMPKITPRLSINQSDGEHTPRAIRVSNPTPQMSKHKHSSNLQKFYQFFEIEEKKARLNQKEIFNLPKIMSL